MLAAENGKPAPAAGWFKRLEWRDDGLYVVDVRWTGAAKQAILAREHRYVSPVFTFDPVTGHVQRLVNAAITNPGSGRPDRLGRATESRNACQQGSSGPGG